MPMLARRSPLLAGAGVRLRRDLGADSLVP